MVALDDEAGNPVPVEVALLVDFGATGVNENGR